MMLCDVCLEIDCLCGDDALALVRELRIVARGRQETIDALEKRNAALEAQVRALREVIDGVREAWGYIKRWLPQGKVAERCSQLREDVGRMDALLGREKP